MRTLLIISLLYFVSGLLLLPSYQHQLNPDTISYINIARRYIVLDFKNAIDPYWGPLFSWMLIPLMVVHIEPTIAVKITQLLIGFLAIVGVKLLINQLRFRKHLQIWCLLTVAPLILYFAYSVGTPDLLGVTITLFYLSFVIDKNFFLGKKSGIFLGILGSLMYFSKSYFFFFFLLHFPLMSVLHLHGNRARKLKKSIATTVVYAFIAFSLLSGIWIIAVSMKLHTFSIGTAGEYNYRLVGPLSRGQPMHYQGFLSPPAGIATSAWDSPSDLILPSWNPFDYPLYQVFLLQKNLGLTVSYLQTFSSFSLGVLLLYFVLILSIYRREHTFPSHLYIFITFMLSILSYIVIFPEERYLWFAFLLLVIMAAHIIQSATDLPFFAFWHNVALLVFLAISFTIMPTQHLFQGRDTGKDVYELSQFLRQKDEISGNIASNSNWYTSLYLAFYFDSKYYGEKGEIPQDSIADALRANSIDYYFYWLNSGEKTDTTLNNYSDLYVELPFLRIYKVSKE